MHTYFLLRLTAHGTSKSTNGLSYSHLFSDQKWFPLSALQSAGTTPLSGTPCEFTDPKTRGQSPKRAYVDDPHGLQIAVDM
jgi:hypothetical protein